MCSIFCLRRVELDSMQAYDRDVKEKLGTDAYGLILREVDSGVICHQKMRDIAEGLYPAEVKIVGNHQRRISAKGGKSDSHEMRSILSDWWLLGDLHEISKEEALQRLVMVFREEPVMLKPLATALANLLPKGNGHGKVEKYFVQYFCFPDPESAPVGPRNKANVNQVISSESKYQFIYFVSGFRQPKENCTSRPEGIRKVKRGRLDTK